MISDPVEFHKKRVTELSAALYEFLRRLDELGALGHLQARLNSSMGIVMLEIHVANKDYFPWTEILKGG